MLLPINNLLNKALHGTEFQSSELSAVLVFYLFAVQTPVQFICIIVSDHDAVFKDDNHWGVYSMNAHIIFKGFLRSVNDTLFE